VNVATANSAFASLTAGSSKTSTVTVTNTDGGTQTYTILVYRFPASNQFSYTSTSTATFTVPVKGKYKIEAYGAAGGLGSDTSVTKAAGGYAKGTISLTRGEALYIIAGQAGNNGSTASGYPGGTATSNGGGKGSNGSLHPSNGNKYAGGGSGGGASSVSLASGAWSDWNVLKNRILVAGGGGGSGYTIAGSAGGSITSSAVTTNGSPSSVPGAKQSAPTSATSIGLGKFGTGATPADKSYADGGAEGNGGGGGGYWGGNVFNKTGVNSNSGGTGGSSYVSGLSGCYALSDTSFAAASTPSSITMAANANHPSGKVFTDASTTSGGGSTGTGKVIITYIGQ
jgi:hypothetical protein